MNWLHSKLARLIIKGRWYDQDRWEEMIELSHVAAQEAQWHFREGWSGLYDYYSEKEAMYRRRAEWYLKRIREKKSSTK